MKWGRKLDTRHLNLKWFFNTKSWIWSISFITYQKIWSEEAAGLGFHSHTLWNLTDSFKWALIGTLYPWRRRRQTDIFNQSYEVATRENSIILTWLQESGGCGRTSRTLTRQRWVNTWPWLAQSAMRNVISLMGVHSFLFLSHTHTPVSPSEM